MSSIKASMAIQILTIYNNVFKKKIFKPENGPQKVQSGGIRFELHVSLQYKS